MRDFVVTCERKKDKVGDKEKEGLGRRREGEEEREGRRERGGERLRELRSQSAFQFPQDQLCFILLP